MHFYENPKEIDMPVLKDGRIYIYVLENYPQGNIKIGYSSNMQKRIKDLSGSNSGGNHIVNCAVSDATWLKTMESIAHMHFKDARIDGEWFDGSILTFDEAVSYIDSLFASNDYDRCNEARKNFIAEHKDNIISADTEYVAEETEEYEMTLSA